jgi:hypothetical protein
MAVVTRYFSTTGAGGADGTTWADRAALFSAGSWDTGVLTAFNFSGSDSLRCLIGPGTYTCSQALAAGLFANPPTIANPLILQGCDSSGNPLAIPDPDWVSPMPAWSDSTLPVIATTTNISTISQANVWCYLLKFTASGRNSNVVQTSLGLSWCHVVNSTANTAALCTTSQRLYGCVLKCTGSSYASIVLAVTASLAITNTRIEGVAGSSGNRRGIEATATTSLFDMVTVVNCGGAGIEYTGSNAAQTIRLRRSTIANNGGEGFKTAATASQTENYEVHGCMITGNTTAGISGNTDAARIFVQQTRLRDNTTNISAIGNYPTDLNNYTTDDSDANEYVSTGADGDFRIKNTASNVWNKGFGAGDEAAAGGAGGGGLIMGGTVIQ